MALPLTKALGGATFWTPWERLKLRSTLSCMFSISHIRPNQQRTRVVACFHVRTSSISVLSDELKQTRSPQDTSETIAHTPVSSEELGDKLLRQQTSEDTTCVSAEEVSIGKQSLEATSTPLAIAEQLDKANLLQQKSETRAPVPESGNTSFRLHRLETKTKLPQAKFTKLLLETFAELDLKPIQETGGRVRVRQHVNPLKASLMAPLAPIKWESVFADCSLPLTVDIGCGSGRFLMVLAKRSSGSQNFMGLDVREALVDRAKLWAERLHLSGNLHFLTTNAAVGFKSLMSSYPGPLSLVSILCPDPHFKKRHQKRKVVQRELVISIIQYLMPGGCIFLQSDVEYVALDMRAQFDEHLGSSLVAGGDGPKLRDSEGWFETNPLGVPSEREAQVLATGGRIYRAVYRKMCSSHLVDASSELAIEESPSNPPKGSWICRQPLGR